MSVPETTLANPIIDAAYAPFLEVYTGVRKASRSEVDRLALALTKKKGAPSPDVIRRHQVQDTPSLAEKGRGAVEESIAKDYILGVTQLVKDQESSIQAFLKEMTHCGDQSPPSLNWASIINSRDLLERWRDALYWLNVVDKIIQAAYANGWVKWKGAWVSRRLSLIPHGGEFLLCSTDVCLMLKDMMYSRFIIPLYCLLDPHRSHLTSYLQRFEVWGAEVLVMLGNMGYDVIKGIEALAQTALIEREEKILDGAKQHENMLHKYREKEIKAGGTGLLIDKLEVYLNSFTSSRDMAEAFGFLKLWGHPYVDPYAGCVAVQGLGKAKLNLKVSDCLKLEWSFCHLYCRGYLKTKGRWPRLRFIPKPDSSKTQLEGLVEKDQPSLAFGFTQYPASDWQWTLFEENLVFDEGDDILSLVVDKSISHSRSNFDSTWRGRLPYTPPLSPSSTRVLEELITRPEVDLRGIVETVSRREIPWEWRIVSVCPKEREMKRDPRMFSMMVLEMRLFFVLAEHNIAEGVFKSMQEQTMTLSRQELLDLFLSSTRPVPNSWVRAVIGIDFSKWNTMWRAETVHPIGRRMDQLYGKSGVFSVVHDFFESSLCLLRLPDYPPDHLTESNRHNPPEGRSLWYGHKGGFEGIAQKLWTACTVALIHMSLWEMGLSYRIIGQGDNQVCIVDVYVPSNLSEDQIKAHVRNIVDNASRNIADVSKTVGQEVKPEECIQSTCFLTYGKEMILHGAYLPTALKYVSRLFPATTGDAPSLYEMVSSISSGASGATERNDWSYPTYYLAKFMEGITFTRELKRSMLHGTRLSDEASKLVGSQDPDNIRDRRTELLRLLIAIPSNLGGMPIATFPELMYRGHADPLNSSLLHLEALSQLPEVRRYKQVLMKGWLFNPKPDITSLIADPFSLPLRSGSTPTGSVASATSSILRGITKNVQFKGMLDRATPAHKQGLVDWLSSLRPFYPKVAHDLYKGSLVGVCDAFSKRFTNTRTLIGISRKSEMNIANISIQSDFFYFKRVLEGFHLTWKIGSSEGTYTRTQVYRVAALLRQSWLSGTPLEGVTVAHPLSVGILHGIPGEEGCEITGCRIVVAGLTTNSTRGLNSRGPSNPYLGSVTSDKSVAKWIRPLDTSPPLKDVLKILSIRSMMSLPGSDLYQSLTNLAQSRSLIPVEEIEPFHKVKRGGTDAHRYRTRDDARGSFWNSCFNWPTHLTISTNLAGELGASDYPFSFQEALMCLSSLICWDFCLTPTEPPWGLSLEVNLSLMDQVSDHIVDSVAWDPPQVPPPIGFYASVNSVSISSRASDTAYLASPALPDVYERSASSTELAIAAVFLSTFRSRHPITTRYGHAIGIPQSQRVIDLPEVSLITTQQALEGLDMALWLKIGLPLALMCTARSRPAPRLLRSLVDLESRRGIPALAGTLREVHRGNPLYGLGLGLGREAEADALARWMNKAAQDTLKRVRPFQVHLYERGMMSVSSMMSSCLGVVAAFECLSDDPVRFRNGKLLAKLVRRINQELEEHTRVRLLAILTRVGNLADMFKVDRTSPEEVLRALRTTEGNMTPTDRGRVRRIYEAPLIQMEYKGGSAILQFPTRPLPLASLVTSWMNRWPGIPEAAERWSPLASLYRGDQRVLLVGVGQGDIGGAIPLGWEVEGVELASALAPLGHSFLDYKPPGLGDQFSLHPLSWTTSGDATTQQVEERLIGLLRTKRYTLCLLDLEMVDNHKRLQLRSRLASTGVPTHCKVLVSEDEGHLLTSSWAAYKEEGDTLWTTRSYPGQEFVVGASGAPLGVFAAVPQPGMVYPILTVPPTLEYHIGGYEDYSPSADLMMLTGHLASSLPSTVTGLQLRGIFPFLSKIDLTEFRWSTEREGWELLLKAGCPRRRVRALIRLSNHNRLTPGWKEDLVKLEDRSRNHDRVTV